MSTEIKPSEVLDHAGFLFDWFEDAQEVDGDLVITIGPDVNEEGEAEVITVTPEELYEAVERYKATGNFSEYEEIFLQDLLDNNYNQTDGDTMIVDAILQFAAFGEIVYG